jgi:flagella basal body P-ring formation protein FlgA
MQMIQPMSISRLLIRTIFWGSLFCSCNPAWTAELRLRAQCTTSNPSVTLGDVAEILTSDRQQAKQLAAIELFPSPVAARQNFVRVREIQDALTLRDVNLAEHRFSGANQVAISGGGDSPRADADPSPPPVINRKSNLRVQEAEAIASVVAIRSIGRGTVIRDTDVELQNYQTRDAVGDLLTSLEDVIGKETTRSIPAGKPVPRDSLREPLLVRKGDVVTVNARSAGIRVRTSARARDDGSLGDLIAVESLQDRNTFYVRVDGVREVEVFAHGVQAEASPPPKNVTLMKTEVKR